MPETFPIALCFEHGRQLIIFLYNRPSHSHQYNNMLGDLYVPHEMPEAPKESFFKGLFGGGMRNLDREELCKLPAYCVFLCFFLLHIRFTVSLVSLCFFSWRIERQGEPVGGETHSRPERRHPGAERADDVRNVRDRQGAPAYARAR